MIETRSGGVREEGIVALTALADDAAGVLAAARLRHPLQCRRPPILRVVLCRRQVVVRVDDVELGGQRRLVCGRQPLRQAEALLLGARVQMGPQLPEAARRGGHNGVEAAPREGAVQKGVGGVNSAFI